MNYFDNKAIVDKTYNGKANGSNAVALPGAAYVDLDIDNLNDDMYFTYTDPVTQEIETIASADNGSASSKELVVDFNFSNGTAGYTPSSNPLMDVIDNNFHVITRPDDNSAGAITPPYPTIIGKSYIGTCKTLQTNSRTQYRLGSSLSAEDYGRLDNLTVGEHSLSFVATTISFYGFMYNLTDEDITSIWDWLSLKQVLPTATKYRMTNDFSDAVSHDTPFSQEDLDLMKADPLTLMRVFFDGLVLPSGFAKVNMKHYYVGNEGVNGGAYVQDICVDRTNPQITDAENQFIFSADTEYLHPSGFRKESADSRYTGITGIDHAIPAGQDFYCMFTVSNMANITFARLQIGVLNNYTTINVGEGSYLVKFTNNTTMRDFKFRDDNSILGCSYVITNIQVWYDQDFPGIAEIQNYTDACRTAYLNSNKGMSNLLLEQDASGRPAATLPDNTVDFKNSNGANVNTGFKPSLPKMTIKEVVSGNLADLDSNGNPLGTFSERTEHRAIKMWKEEGEPNSWEWETTTANETMEIPVKATNTYDMTIEWGDGDSEAYTGDGSVKPSHVYITAGSYEVVLTGICPQLYFYGTTEVTKVTKILGLGETGLITCSGMYWDAVNLQDCTFGLCDTSKVTNMYAMMGTWSSMTTAPDLTSFNTSNVTNMYAMMGTWTSMTTTPDLSNFDTSNVTDMRYMMYNWSSMTTAPDLSSFDTSKVTSMASMMYKWSSMGEIGNIGIENFNISSLTTASLMLTGTTVATATMDLILVNWEAQSHKSNVIVHFGEGNYTLGGAAETAYNNLVADGWSISGITGV